MRGVMYDLSSSCHVMSRHSSEHFEYISCGELLFMTRLQQVNTIDMCFSKKMCIWFDRNSIYLGFVCCMPCFSENITI